MMYHSRFRLESPDVVVVLADAGRHHGGQHGASHGGKGEVPVQVSQNASLNISWKMFVCFSSDKSFSMSVSVFYKVHFLSFLYGVFNLSKSIV